MIHRLALVLVLVLASAGVGPGAAHADPAVCADGQVAVGEHCCWPGQGWGDESGTCRGIPQCPAGLTRAGETCVAYCPSGFDPTPDRLHCCRPGQEWSRDAAACVGIPRCGHGEVLSRDERSCLAAPPEPPPPCDAACQDARAADAGRAARRQRWGSLTLVGGLGYLMTYRASQGAIGHGLDLMLGIKPDGVPVFGYGSVNVGGYRGYRPECLDAPCGRGPERNVGGWSLGVAFAPWAGDPTFRPYAGVGVRGVYFGESGTDLHTAPDDAVAPTVVVGQGIYFRRWPVLNIQLEAARRDGTTTYFVSVTSIVALGLLGIFN